MGLLIGVGQTRPQFAYDYYYGIEWDSAVSNPSCTRIGKSELHSELPLQKMMRRCLLADNGTVLNYLSPTDSTKLDTGANADLTGAHGQVMVELPDVYIRFEADGQKRRCLMSPYSLPGFKKWGKDYVSAWEATVDRTTAATPKLASVVNTTTAFRGGGNNSAWDGTYRDLCGRPATSISLTNFRAYAHNRGEGWQCNTYRIHKKLWWLFAVEYATLNSQAAFNAELTSEGYHQGGLGDGVTTLADAKWSAFNSYNPFIPCGHTKSLGNATGVVDYTMPTEYDATAKVVSVPSYRGVENPFGHVWKWTDGILLNIQSNDDGGRSMMYECHDTSKYSSTITDDYIFFADAPRSNGYVKAIALGDNGDIMPTAIGGGSTTYFCDYFYTNIPASGESTRGVLFGGGAYTGASAGFVYALTATAPLGTNADVGSRLCFEPENRDAE